MELVYFFPKNQLFKLSHLNAYKIKFDLDIKDLIACSIEGYHTRWAMRGRSKANRNEVIINYLQGVTKRSHDELRYLLIQY